MGLLDSIIGTESGGNPNATNPNSSATGPGQFINSTWLGLMHQYHPEIQGSDADLLALRNDPTLSREMTANYAAQNQKVLSDNGLPVTDGTTYLAHFAGPQGAVKVLQADPNAPVSGILGQAAVKANPFLQGMSASDLRAWADRKMGGSKLAQATPGMAATSSPAAAQPTSLAPSASPPVQQQQVQIPASAPSYWQQFPAEQAQAQPMMNLLPPRRPTPDLTNLRMALASRGLFNLGQS